MIDTSTEVMRLLNKSSLGRFSTIGLWERLLDFDRRTAEAKERNTEVNGQPQCLKERHTTATSPATQLKLTSYS